MTRYSKAAYGVKYNDPTSGLLKDARPIVADSHRQQVEDTADSFLSHNDDIFRIFGVTECVAGVGSNDYEIAHTYEISSYNSHRVFVGNFNRANTAAVTLFFAALGSKDLKKFNGFTSGIANYVDLDAGDISGNSYFLIAYDDDEDQFVIVGGVGSSEPVATLEIESTNVLVLNATPLPIILSEGAGTAQVPEYIELSMVFNSVAYTGNTMIYIGYVGFDPIFVDTGDFLASSEDRNMRFTIPVVDIKPNVDLYIGVMDGDPEDGDSDITVRVKYKTITL